MEHEEEPQPVEAQVEPEEEPQPVEAQVEHEEEPQLLEAQAERVEEPQPVEAAGGARGRAAAGRGSRWSTWRSRSRPRSS